MSDRGQAGQGTPPLHGAPARTPRAGERPGEDYYFVSPKAFLELVQANAFLEHAEYAGNNYGTSWRALEEPLEEGFDLLVEIANERLEPLAQRRKPTVVEGTHPPAGRATSR